MTPEMVLMIISVSVSTVSLVLCLFLLVRQNEIRNVRTNLNKRIDALRDSTQTAISDGLRQNTETMNLLSTQVKTVSDSVNIRMNTVSDSVNLLTNETRQQLDEIRTSVNEKLTKTINDRMTESFRIVGNQLEEVHRSLGEMQSLADGVTDLKKILANVKTRGIFGETQLSRILEQMLTREQYSENIATKAGSSDVVEFAIKLPGKDSDSPVFLPIDAKFPLDIYTFLMDAYDSGDQEEIANATRNLESVMKKNAKDIHDKYIDPPGTTDFAILFLPTEGLYSEVIRRTSLIESIASTYSVIISGPSTLSALLNSLQMGFRTLAIEKRSHEVWQILGAVKTEFETFESSLNTVRKRLEMADRELDSLVGVRTRAVMKKLKEVESLPEEETKLLFEEEQTNNDEDIL